MAAAHRIVSLVPSHTESLHDLGLADCVVGRTRFCISPAPWVDSIPTVGGTKDAKLERILALRPTAVVADKDENPKALVEALEAEGIDVVWSDIATAQDAAAFLLRLGQRFDAQAPAKEWVQRIDAARSAALRRRGGAVARLSDLRVFCPIWHNPWMTFDGTAYPSAILADAGFANAFAQHSGARYFAVEEPDVARSGAQWTLLPTEPFPFHKHTPDTRALGAAGRAGRVRVIDGEALTWFGTRTAHGLEVLSQVAADLRGPASS